MTRKEYILKHKKDYKKLYPLATQTIKDKYIKNEIYKIGYLDIETSGLTGNFDIMLSWAMVVRDIETEKTSLRCAYITKKDVLDSVYKKRDASLIDKRIIEKLMEDISDIDALIGHWFVGYKRHDIPFVRTRCAINEVPGFPKHKQMRYGDTWKWGSLTQRLSSNGLATLADAFNITLKKTQILHKDWQLACFGDTKAIKYVLQHNIKDSKITYRVHKHLEDYVGIPAIYA